MAIGLKGGWTGSIAGGSNILSVSRNGPTFGQIKLEFKKRLESFGFAALVALTRTGSEIKKAQPIEMKKVFDRPKPWTTNAVYLKPATKVEPWARVWLKNEDASASANYDFAASRASRSGGYRVSKRQSKGTPAAKYLLPQIKGGPRPAKGFEKLLRASGKIGSNEFIVPGKQAPLDRYGNLSQGTITKVLSDLGSLNDPLSNRAGTPARMSHEGRWGGPITPKAKSKYFVGTVHGVKAIWQRVGRRIVPIMLVVGQPMYTPRYDFVGVGRRVFRREWSRQLQTAVAQGYSKSKPL